MSKKNIAVSVVVPTIGRDALLNRCLDALSRQTLPGAHYEIIVVDDRPSRTTMEIVAGWSSLLAGKGPAVIYIANKGATHGPAAARNRGWRAARAAIVAFTDDDTLASPGWLAHGLAAFDENVHALCGQIEMPVPDLPTDYERDASRLETSEFVTANCFCRKHVLELLDGFDERFRLAWREDSDLHFRLLGLQANIRHIAQAVVVHPVRAAPWGISIFQQKKIFFDALLYKKHPLLYRQKIRAAPRWDYYLTVTALLIAVIGLAFGNLALAGAGSGVWFYMTARFCLARLRGTARTFSHVAEMIVTSAAIPPHAVFWRMVGAVRFRVRFL
jgi:GT2 family glycosyltransferase